MTLDDRIEMLLDQGHADPHVVARLTVDESDEDWLLEQLRPLAGEIIATRARLLIHRRRAGLDLEGPARTASRAIPIMRDGFFVAARGQWVRTVDLTADDCRSIAEHYESLARAMAAQATRFRSLADLIEERGVERVGELEEADLKAAA